MIKTLRNLSLFILLVIASQSHGQIVKEDRKEDHIDIEYNECLAKDSTYVNLCNCAFVAFDKWNKELDVSYKKLLKNLKAEKDKNSLKQAQAAWLIFRDAEFKAYNNIFNIPGGKWCGLRQDGRIDIVRERALQLRNYAESFKK